MTNGDDIVLVEKGAKHAKELQNRQQWIENREKRRQNPSTAPVFPLHNVPKPKPRPVKKRKLQKQNSIEYIEEFLKGVKLDHVL